VADAADPRRAELGASRRAAARTGVLAWSRGALR